MVITPPTTLFPTSQSGASKEENNVGHRRRVAKAWVSPGSGGESGERIPQQPFKKENSNCRRCQNGWQLANQGFPPGSFPTAKHGPRSSGSRTKLAGSGAERERRQWPPMDLTQGTPESLYTATETSTGSSPSSRPRRLASTSGRHPPSSRCCLATKGHRPGFQSLPEDGAAQILTATLTGDHPA
jgi:hypothetical protein